MIGKTFVAMATVLLTMVTIALLGSCASKGLVKIDCSVLESPKRELCEAAVKQAQEVIDEKTREEEISDSPDDIEALDNDQPIEPEGDQPASPGDDQSMHPHASMDSIVSAYEIWAVIWWMTIFEVPSAFST